ncbi:MAG: NUDIX domain-containing protein [Thaumarchaeota archaeon]|nr:NUDIX domain-containing protein [Nitrososphaerota archaeon]
MIALKSVRCNACGHPYTVEQLAGASRVITCSNCGTPHQLKQKRRIVRRRGTALIDTPRGILLVAGKRRRFLLPGGGALKGETRRDAVVRELKEEIGLTVKTSSYLFSYDDPKDGRRVRNLHKVFLVEAEGTPTPDNHEVRYVEYWNSGMDILLSDSARAIIDRYLAGLKHQPPPG